MQNPYDSFPREPKGDANPDITHLAVGRALSEWERLEEALGELFARFCESDSEAPARAYGMVGSSGGRVDMLREAFACYRHRRDLQLAPFDKFLNRFLKFAARRNEIAHSIVTTFVPEGSYLHPPQYNSRKIESLASVADRIETMKPDEADALAAVDFGKFSYTAAQIDHYRKHFRALRIEAQGFLIHTLNREAEN